MKSNELGDTGKAARKVREAVEGFQTDYRTLLEQNVDAIIVVDQKRIVRYANPAAAALFGRDAKKYIGRLFEFPVVPGETKEVNLTGKNGSAIIVEIRAAAAKWGGENVSLASLRDVTESVQLREKLHTMSFTDELTGAYNRRGFFMMAERQLKLAKRGKQGMLLFFADVDDLKGINDSLGHHEGDIALVDVARVLKDTFRETDIIARIGGDEFAVLALWAREENADTLTARLRKNLQAHSKLGKRRHKLSLSIGVAQYNPKKPCSIDELLARADALMYRRKWDGGEA